MSKPTILLVPGSFHPPELWADVQEELHKQGRKTSTVALLSNDQLPETHADITQREARAIREHVEKLLESGEDVVMVMHSYAGVPGSEALQGLGKIDREKAGLKTGVVGLVYMCAFMLWEGARMLEDVLLGEDYSGKLKFETRSGGWQHCSNPLISFYQDMPKDRAEEVAKKLVRRDGNLVHAKLTYPAYKHIPTTYIHAEKDQAITIGLQEAMVKKARSSGAEIDVVRWNTGHSPFFVDPKMVADFLVSESDKRQAAV